MLYVLLRRCVWGWGGDSLPIEPDHPDSEPVPTNPEEKIPEDTHSQIYFQGSHIEWRVTSQ